MRKIGVPAKFLIPALVFLFGVPAAMALSQSDLPVKFNIPWGNGSGSPYIRPIPQGSQIGIQNCAASLADGFPPLTFVPQTSGGCPPFGADFNGILKQVTQWNRWQSAGGPLPYDGTFSAAVGGYPKGAVVQSNVLLGRLWFSTADNNTTSPDDATGGSANWIPLPGTSAAGAPVASFGPAPPNTVPANGLTVGNASSNATNRANADTFWLFSYLWANCPTCQLFNSAGGAISRGGTAAADFAANDAVATVQMNGAALMGGDTQGTVTTTFLNNVPVTSGSRTVATSVVGENLHALTSGENGPHTHSITDPTHKHESELPTFAGGAGAGAQACSGSCLSLLPASVDTTFNATGITATNSSGSGTAHNTVARSVVTKWNLAL
jgi:hypothetical protein